MTKRNKPGKRVLICPRCSHWIPLTGSVHVRIGTHNCIGAELTEVQYRIWRGLPMRMEFKS